MLSEVAVFSTNVIDTGQSELLTMQLQQQFPGSRISFDLEDCDKVLRVEGKDVDPAEIIRQLHTTGYRCEEML